MVDISTQSAKKSQSIIFDSIAHVTEVCVADIRVFVKERSLSMMVTPPP